MTSARNNGGEARFEFWPGLAFAAVALTLVGFVPSTGIPSAALGRVLNELGVVFFLIAAGFLSTYCTAKVRLRGPLGHITFARRGARALPAPFQQLRKSYDQLYETLANTDWRGDWLPLLIIALAATGTLVVLSDNWPQSATPAPSSRVDEWAGGLLIAAAFPVLVLERRFAGLSAHISIDAPVFVKLLRLLLLDVLGFAFVFLLFWLGTDWAVVLERAVVVVTGLVAAELLLRAAAYLFMPLSPLESRQSHADSLAAGLIRLQWPDLGAVNATVSRQFGIDLSRSWALAFIHRSTFPVLLSLVVAGWLLTGVTALGLNQRAVYEVFGRPEAVFHSGLHIHLPWPFGILRPVEYGEVHEIPIIVSGEKEGAAQGEATMMPSSIEGPPPTSADRLWDASHPSEASYLVASDANGQESFEIVNIDLRIIYRIGLSDKAAYDVLYNVESPQALIRAATGRMLAYYFARYTIADVLGQNRAAFIRGFQRELRDRLSQLGSGVDILGVVVEAIHPPPDAAAAYQNVQAAAIRSVTAIAAAHGTAIRQIAQTDMNTERLRADATASAAETIDRAKTDTTFFTADAAAYHREGTSYLFERRLGAVSAALRPYIPYTVIDSRIPASAMPTLDLLKPGTTAVVPETEDEQ